MIEIRADLWTLSPDEYPALRLITTNGERRRSDGAAVMGRGCARQARDRSTGIDHKLGELLGRYGNRVMRLAKLVDGSDLATFPVKHGWRGYADLVLIERSAQQLVELADRFGYRSAFVPRPGAGAGGLDYERDVKPVLEGILVGDRFRVITV